MLLAGDVNIRLDRTTDLNTVKFSELLVGYGLVQQVHDVTDDAGGIPDVVCTPGDLSAPAVDVVDFGISDHRMLSWTSNVHRPSPIYETRTSRPPHYVPR